MLWCHGGDDIGDGAPDGAASAGVGARHTSTIVAAQPCGQGEEANRRCGWRRLSATSERKGTIRAASAATYALRTERRDALAGHAQRSAIEATRGRVGRQAGRGAQGGEESAAFSP